MPDQVSAIEAASWWLEQGYELLPCQPGTRTLVAGFGPRAQKITTREDAERLWRDASDVNLAVACPADHFIIDFSDTALYVLWTIQLGGRGTTYTEVTPRGGRHAFYRGHIPPGVRLVPGAELKDWCLVAPSIVRGVSYQRGVHAIQSIDPGVVLFPLSPSGARTPHLLRGIEITQAAKALRARERQLAASPFEPCFDSVNGDAH